jgi:Uma2 family endonuclease
MVLTVSREQIQLPPGSEVTLRYQTWTDYEALLASRRDDAAVKIRFNAHTQEISLMAPLAGHGNRSRTLAELVTALLRHQNRDWHGFDPVTLKRLRRRGRSRMPVSISPIGRRSWVRSELIWPRTRRRIWRSRWT